MKIALGFRTLFSTMITLVLGLAVLAAVAVATGYASPLEGLVAFVLVGALMYAFVRQVFKQINAPTPKGSGRKGKGGRGPGDGPRRPE